MTSLFGQFARPVKKTKKKTIRTLPITQAFVQALASENIRIGYDALSAAALTFGEVKPSGQSHGQRGANLVTRLPVALQPMVCRGGTDEERIGGYHKTAAKKWEEAGLDVSTIRKDLETLPVLGLDEATEAAETFQASIDDETGEPIDETETDDDGQPTGLESEDDPTE